MKNGIANIVEKQVEKEKVSSCIFSKIGSRHFGDMPGRHVEQVRQRGDIPPIREMRAPIRGHKAAIDASNWGFRERMLHFFTREMFLSERIEY